jgi:hypothetical protein
MKKLWQAILKFLIQIRDFFLCLLQDNCIYSIKKVLVFAFSTLAIWMVLTQHLDQLELVLGFVAILLGIRSYERLQQQKSVNINKE